MSWPNLPPPGRDVLTTARGATNAVVCGAASAIMVHVDVTFYRARDGAPYANLGTRWPGFNETLSDAVTSMPPRGSMEHSVSTYWIDRVQGEIERMKSAHLTGPFQGGNATTLVLDNGQVRACSDYETFEDEVMTVESFIEVLSLWRAEVVRVRESETPEIPETYRRNPYPA